MEIKPVAYIHTDFPQKFGIPRQSGRVQSLTARVVFTPEFRDPLALKGIQGFSHLWLLFDFSLAHKQGFTPTVRPPRLGGNTRMGVFATRSPFRPNHIGLSSVKLVAVEHTEEEGDVLVVSGADLLDGTPIYDIKPYLPFTDSHPEATGGFAEAHVEDKLVVNFPQDLLALLPEAKRQAVVDCLAEDPRPSYQEDESRVYGMAFAGFDVRFTVQGKTLTIVDVKKI